MALLLLLWSLLTLRVLHFLSHAVWHNCDFQAVFVILTISFVAGGDDSISSISRPFPCFLPPTLSLFVVFFQIFHPINENFADRDELLYMGIIFAPDHLIGGKAILRFIIAPGTFGW